MFRKLMANAAIATLLLTAAVIAKAQGGDPLDQVATYDFGKSRAPLMQIEEMSRKADQKAKIEDAMIKVIENKDATFAGKQFACRMLRLVGTEKSVPALAGLLSDEKLNHMARWAMQMMPYASVDEAFAKALDSVKGSALVGVISSMGARKDVKSVAKLAVLATDANTTTAQAAIVTLGQVGGAEAAQALAGLKPADKKSQTLVADARLLAADQLLKAGKKDEAQAIYTELYADSNPPVVRMSALRGIVKTQQAQALPALTAAIKDVKHLRVAGAAMKYYNDIPGSEATKALCDLLPTLDPKIQVMALATLASRGDKTAGDAAAAMMANTDESVRIAAAKALAIIGGPAQVAQLVKAAAVSGPAGDAAQEALGLVHGEGVSAAVREQLASSDAQIKEKAIMAVETRRDGEAIAALIKATQDSDRKVKTAAAKALGAVAGEKDLPTLTDLLVKSKSEGEQSSMEKALIAVVSRIQSKDAAADTIVAKMGEADNAAKGHLLVVLAGLTGPKAFDAISAQIKSSDLELKKAAIRAFATWPEKKPAPMLLEVAKSDSDAACKAIALRGFVDVASLAPDATAQEKVEMLKDAMEIAKAYDEKTKILSGLAKVSDPAALKLVEPCLDDAQVGTAAQLAYVQIAAGMKNKREGIAAVQKVLAIAKDANVKRQAQSALNKLDRNGAQKKGGQKAGQKNGQKKGGKGGRNGKKKAAAPAIQ